MKHVCVDARLITATGIGKFLRSLVETLEKAPHIHLTVLNFETKIHTLKEQFDLVKKIPPCDLFWTTHFNVPLLPIRARKRVTTIHDVYHLAHFSTLPLARKCYAKLFYNASFKLSDCVTTSSEFSKSEILKYATFRPKNLIKLLPPFDFTPAPERERGEFLLSIGNLKPHKNLLRLVRAYKKLQPKQRLYIVGKKEGLTTSDSELFREVEKDSFLKKNVYFTGYLSDEKVKELYAGAKLFLFPSYYEGFGYPPLEAMASGCPVVASHAASIPEMCGDAVEYVDPFSVDDIARGIERVLYDQKRSEELIEKGRVHVEAFAARKNGILDVIDACCGCS